MPSIASDTFRRRNFTPARPTPEPILDRLAFAFLALFVMAIPLEGNTMIGGFVITRWLGLLALGTTLLRLGAGGRARKLCALHAWLAAFFLWAVASLIWTIDTEMTLSRIGSYAQLLIMTWLIWELATTRERWIALLYAYCGGALYSSIHSVRNLVWGLTDASAQAQKLAEYGRFAPEGFDQNEFALMLAISIPMAVYLLTRRQSILGAALCWAQIALGTIAILLTGSRAGLVALAAAYLMLPVALPSLRGWKRKICWAALPALVVCAAAFVPANTWQRLLTTGSELSGAGTLDHRTVIWSAGLMVFRQHPLLGVGAGAFGPSVVGTIDINYVAHNSFLSILVELGVVGALILIGILASSLYLGFRMGGLDRWLWAVLLLTWAAGASSLTWEYRKTTWFLFGMVAAEAALKTRRLPSAFAASAPGIAPNAPARDTGWAGRPAAGAPAAGRMRGYV